MPLPFNLTPEQAAQIEALMGILAGQVASKVGALFGGVANAAANQPTIVVERQDSGQVVKKQTTMAQLHQDFIDIMKDANDLMARQIILAHGEEALDCKLSELASLKAHRRKRSR